MQVGPTEADGTYGIPRALLGRQQGTGRRMPEAGCGGVSTAAAVGNS